MSTLAAMKPVEPEPEMSEEDKKNAFIFFAHRWQELMADFATSPVRYELDKRAKVPYREMIYHLDIAVSKLRAAFIVQFGAEALDQLGI